MSLETVRPVCDQQKTLNEACIKAAEPGDVLRDATIRGLHLRCFADRKSFYLYYRTRAGVERRPKLGDHGSISLAHARKLAKDMLQEVAAGNDPSQARADARAEPTLADLWDEYWKRHGSRKKSSDEDERIWEQYLAPLATKKLSHITYPMIADLHQKITDRPAPIQANRVLAMLSKMFSFGIRPLEWMSSNPATGVAKNRESKRKRYMKGGEAAAISALLQREAEANPASVAFLYLLILTGARKGEIAGARWSQLHGNKLVLSEHKTDQAGLDRVIHLPPAAMDVIERLPRTSGTITGILDPKKLWNKIRTEAGCPDLHLHDLRHSFASAAVSAGLSLPQIGELLGHSSTETTKRYAHLMDDAAVVAAGSVSDQIMARMRPASAQPMTIQ